MPHLQEQSALPLKLMHYSLRLKWEWVERGLI